MATIVLTLAENSVFMSDPVVHSKKLKVPLIKAPEDSNFYISL